MSTFERLLDFLLPYRMRLLLAVGLLALACLLSLALPLLVQHLVDRLADREEVSLPLFALGLGLFFVLQAGVGLGNTLVLGRVSLNVVRDLRRRLYARLQKVGVGFYDRTPAGAIISRLMDDVAAVQNLVSGQSVTILIDLGTAVLVAFLLATRSMLLLLVALTLVPVYIGCFYCFSRRIRTATEQVRQQLDSVFSHLKAKFDGILVVKAHAREEAEISEFAAQIHAAHGPRVQVEYLGAAFSSLSFAAGGIGAALVFAVGAFEVLHGRLTVGALVSAAVLAGFLFGPINRLVDLAALFQKASASVARLGDILDSQTEQEEIGAPVVLKRPRGLVEFDNVSFAYDGKRPVLHDIKLHIEPGMKIAVVGPTGCGKTTLLHLLVRFYDPLRGEIRLDGTPLSKISLQELRSHVGVVPQEPIIFRQTVADNIRFGTPGADQERIEKAAKASLVHMFASRLPAGYETMIGEGGHKLSQGQKQRIAIARALCKDPALVVLDEATSSLDSASEAFIQSALGNLLKDRTAFIIAHRLATVAGVDRILVMDAGRIVQAGSHLELLAQKDGLYHRLCERQFGLCVNKSPAKPEALLSCA